jgi:TP901 family phage tail tape measure protein
MNEKSSFGLDISDFEKGQEILIKLFNQINTNMQAVGVTGVQLSKHGKLISASFEAITKEGKNVQATLKGITDEVVRYNEKAGRFQSKGFIAASDVARLSSIKFPSSGGGPDDGKLRDLANKMNALFDINKVKSFYAAWDAATRENINRQFAAQQRIKDIQQKRDMEAYSAAAKIAQKHIDDANRLKALQQGRDVEAYNAEVKLFQKQVADAQRLKMIQQGRDIEMYKKDNAPTALDSLMNRASVIASGILISQVLLKITSEFQGAVDNAAKFQIKISEIRTLSQENQLSMAGWSNEVRNLSDRFGVDIFDVTAGVYETLSNQIAKGTEATSFMSTAMKFAAVTVSSTQNAVDLLSSTLNSYGASAGDAEHHSAILFKLIDYGRVRADEIGNTFGTVTAISSKLGVSLEETSASISVMTRQGVTASNAMTYTRNIMASLLKPSDSLKQTFKEWGVVSGEAAIKTFGWVGVLKKLNDEVDKGGLAELSENFKNLRSLQGTALLSGKGFEDFKQDLEGFKNASTSYAQASKIAFESSGKALEMQFNKIKTFFIVDLGQKAVQTIVSLSKPFGGLANIVKSVTVAIAATTVAWVAFKLATISSATPAVASLITAFTRLNAVILANPLAAFGAALAATAVYIYSTYESSSAVAKRFYDETSAASEATYAAEHERISKQTADNEEAVNKRYQILYKSLSDTRVLYQQSAEDIRHAFETINESVKEVMDSNIQSVRDRLSELMKDVHEAESFIKQSEKFVAKLKTKEDRKAFSVGLQDAPDSQKVGMLQDKVEQLKKEALEALNKGEIEDYRDLWAEAVQLADDALKITKDTRREATAEAKEKVALNKEALRIVKEMHDLETKTGRKLDDAAEASGKATLKEFRKFKPGSSKNINAIQDGNASQADIAKGVDRTLQDAKTKWNELKQKLGEVNSKAAILNGKVAETLQTREKELTVEQQKKKLIEEQIEIEGRLQEQKKKVAEDAKKEANEKKLGLKELERVYKEILSFQLNDNKGKAKKDFSAEDAADRLQKFAGLTERFGNLSDNLGISPEANLGVIKTFQDKLDLLKVQSDKLFGEEQGEKLNAAIDKSREKLIALNKELGANQQKITDNMKTATDEAVASLKGVDFLSPMLKSLIAHPERFSSADRNTTLINSQDELRTLMGQMQNHGSSFSGDIKSFIANIGLALDAISRLKVLQQQQGENSAALDAFAKANAVVTENVNSTAKALKAEAANFEALTVQVNAYAEAGAKVNKVYDDLINRIIGEATAPPAEQTYNYGQGAAGAYYANGGFVPKGRDTIPAMLSPGEFIMNARSTRAYFGQLVAMNAGVRPQYKAAGGPVTTVGDIHINVSGGNNTKTTVREIGKELSRAIRRGTIKF